MSRARKPLTERHAAKVDTDTGPIVVPELGRCHIWRGAVSSTGYGIIWIESNVFAKAHRVALALHLQRDIAPAEIVLHACDNPLCVNPAHLSVGTVRENVEDMVRKGRNYRAVGAKNGRARLSEEDVTAIRADPRGNTALAAAYGVQPNTIYRIRSGRSWSDLTSKERTA